MREFEEFTQYRQRFKPFRKLSETQIDDIIAAFENKGKFTVAFFGPAVEIAFAKLLKPST